MSASLLVSKLGLMAQFPGLDVFVACFFGFLLIPTVAGTPSDTQGSAVFPFVAAITSLGFLASLVVLHYFWNSDETFVDMAISSLDLKRVVLPMRSLVHEQCTLL